MRRMARDAMLCTTIISLSCWALADDPFWIVVYEKGEPTVMFLPREERHTDNGPKVVVPTPGDRTVETEDGRLVAGFELTGWMKGSEATVLVFLLLARQAESIPSSGLEQAERRLFASYEIELGDEVQVSEMKKLGLEPFVIKGESEKPEKEKHPLASRKPNHSPPPGQARARGTTNRSP